MLRAMIPVIMLIMTANHLHRQPQQTPTPPPLVIMYILILIPPPPPATSSDSSILLGRHFITSPQAPSWSRWSAVSSSTAVSPSMRRIRKISSPSSWPPWALIDVVSSAVPMPPYDGSKSSSPKALLLQTQTFFRLHLHLHPQVVVFLLEEIATTIILTTPITTMSHQLSSPPSTPMISRDSTNGCRSRFVHISWLVSLAYSHRTNAAHISASRVASSVPLSSTPDLSVAVAMA